MRKKQTAGVTSKMETRFLRPVSTNGGDLTLRAHPLRSGATFCSLMRNFTMRRGSCVRSAAALTFAFPQEKAQKDFHFVACELEE